MRGGDTSRQHFDWPLLAAVALLAALGVVNLYSATSVYQGNRADLYIAQLYWLAVGGVIGGVIAGSDHRLLERVAYPAYAVGVFSLVLVAILAKDVRGSARWIEFGAFRFQPSEFMKLLLVLAVSKALSEDHRSEPRRIRDLWLPLVLTAVPSLFVLRQPDLGTAVLLWLVVLAIIATVRIRWRSVLTAVVGMAIVAPLAWTYVLHDYQRDRVSVFLNPEGDLLNRGWHAHHTRVAIGNGGLDGLGFMKGTQNQYLFIPDQFSDFPFPVFAEEWGLVGTLSLLAIYAFICIWGLMVASRARDKFGAMVCVGAVSMIFWHAMINLGMSSGLLPVVGVTLPLFSYGGSSVVTIMASLATLFTVSTRGRRGPGLTFG